MFDAFVSFDSIRNELPTHLYVTTFGRGAIGVDAESSGTLRYFSKIQASNGIWSEVRDLRRTVS